MISYMFKSPSPQRGGRLPWGEEALLRCHGNWLHRLATRVRWGEGAQPMPMAQRLDGSWRKTCGTGGIVGSGLLACRRCLAQAGEDVFVKQQARNKLRACQQSV